MTTYDEGFSDERADERTTVRTAAVKKSDSVSFYGIFFAGFVVFLTIALCAQMVALPWRSWLPGAEGKKSLLGGVKSSVYTFMSFIN